LKNNYESFGLQDQVAIVTGASQGIGQTLAMGLAQAGVHVAVVSRTQAKLEQVAADIEALGRQALVVPTDLTAVAEIQAMVKKVRATFGQINILVNNAAWTNTTPALEVTEEEWDQTLDTSLKGVFFTAQAVAPIMIEQGQGKIVNIGSTLAVTAFKERPVYATAKAGVHQLTRALALEWASQGISVNSMAPCITETPTRRNLFQKPGYKEWITGQMLPIGRWAQPEDLVGAVLFLCSHLSEMVVGHTLMVDGGWTIH
jgi:2-deoxy-D-gluconate 3-dehydrogenase